MNTKTLKNDLFYQVMGQGEPLVMIHGNGEDSTIFMKSAQLLMNEFTVYLIDSVNHGRSIQVDVYSYEDMALRLMSLLDALELSSFHFFGFSDGGIIGLLLAKEYPNRFKSLMIAGVNLYPEGMITAELHHYQEVYQRTKDPLLKLMLDQTPIDPQELKKITCHSLVLCGEYDVIKLSHTKLIHASLSKSTLQIIENHNHTSYVVNNELIAHIILRFLRN